MSKLSTQELRRLHGLMRAAGVTAHKESILAGYGVESSKDLTPAQCAELCDALQKQAAEAKQTPPEVRRWRSVCLDLLTQMGIYKDKASWPRVNEYLKQPRICGKLLYELELIELQALSRKLRTIHAAQLKKAQSNNFLASNN